METAEQTAYFSLRRSQKTELLIDLCYRARRSACTVQLYFKQGTLPAKLIRPFWTIVQNKGYVNSLNVPAGYEIQLSIFSKQNDENQESSDPQPEGGHSNQLQRTAGALRSTDASNKRPHGNGKAQISNTQPGSSKQPGKGKGRSKQQLNRPQYATNLVVQKGF